MTHAQQVAILWEALEHGFMRVDCIVRWADSMIGGVKKPESWIMELSTLNPSDITGFLRLLREHGTEPLPLRWRVQMIVLAYEAGLLSLAVCVPKLFTVLFIDRRGAERELSDERLADALAEWDSLEVNVIAPGLRARFEESFHDYLADANEISALLHLKK